VSQVVVHAQIVDQVALVQTRSFTAQLLPANFKRTHRETVLTVDHDARRRVGWLVGLERDGSRVWGTWTSDTLGLLAIPELYVSAELTWEGGGARTSEITVVGASIVAETASTGVPRSCSPVIYSDSVIATVGATSRKLCATGSNAQQSNTRAAASDTATSST
jgi:hypothetical protein